jgi:hypothetical protein
VVTSADVEDWERDGEVVAARVRRRAQLEPEHVVGFTEDVLLVNAPDNPERLYIAVNGAFEYVVDRDEDPAWWAFLREVDGKHTVADLLQSSGDPEGRITALVQEAIDSRVLAVS